MKTDLFSVPRIGIGVIVLRKDKVLLLKRKGSHGPGQWNLPGGHLDFGETIEECARRELVEETGLKASETKLICVNEELNFIKTDQKHYVTLGVLVEVKYGEPEIKEPDKCERLDWFRLDQLPSPLFAPSQNIIESYRKKVISVTS